MTTAAVACRSLLLLLVAAVLAPSVASGAPRAATPADAFVESLGVNTHLNYTSSPYANDARVRQQLGELGVRNIRDHLVIDQPTTWKRFNAYADELGIRADLIADIRHGGSGATIPKLVDVFAANLTGRGHTLEGPNELDAVTNGGAMANEQQKALWTEARSRAALASTKIVGPAARQASYVPGYGDLNGYTDYGNAHPYPGSGSPSEPRLDKWQAALATQTGGKPNYATETCYHSATAYTGGHKPVEERVAAAYVPRLFMEYYRRGFVRTFCYQLMDTWSNLDRTNEQAHFGMYRYDGTPKPVATAVKNLTGLLADRGAAFSPGQLDVGLSGDLTNVRSVLMQKRDGRFYLALWQEQSVADGGAGSDLSNPDRQVKLSFGQAVAGVKLYRPSRSGSAIDTVSAPGATLDVGVPAELMIAEITPATRPTSAPANLRAEVGPDPATIRLRFDAVDGATSYGVNYRVAGSTTSGAPVPDSTSTTLDVPGLVPGRTYELRVAAKNAAGAGPLTSFATFTLPAVPPPPPPPPAEEPVAPAPVPEPVAPAPTPAPAPAPTSPAPAPETGTSTPIVPVTEPAPAPTPSEPAPAFTPLAPEPAPVIVSPTPITTSPTVEPAPAPTTTTPKTSTRPTKKRVRAYSAATRKAATGRARLTKAQRAKARRATARRAAARRARR